MPTFSARELSEDAMISANMTSHAMPTDAARGVDCREHWLPKVTIYILTQVTIGNLW